MKKLLALILTALMATSLTACSNNEKPNDGYINVSDQDHNSDNALEPEPSDPAEGSEPEPSDPAEGSESEPSDPAEGSEPEPSDPAEGSEPEPSDPAEGSEPEPSDPVEESKPETPTVQVGKLPLADYPDGSYFTKDGKECDDHSNCDWLHECNCINFDGGIQAFAFARYVYFTNSGEHLGSKTELNVDVTAESAKSALKDLPAGTYLGVQTKEGSPHAMIIVSASDDGITVYQANYGGRCLVTMPTYTWEQFAVKFPHLNDCAK